MATRKTTKHANEETQDSLQNLTEVSSEPKPKYSFWAHKHTEFPTEVKPTGNQKGVLAEFHMESESDIQELGGFQFWNFNNAYYPLTPIIPHGF